MLMNGWKSTKMRVKLSPSFPFVNVLIVYELMLPFNHNLKTKMQFVLFSLNSYASKYKISIYHFSIPSKYQF
jgi:hypothetical protein